MIAGIYFNKNYITENQTYLDRIKMRLSKNGINYKVVYGAEDLEDVEVLFVLGGDGTILMMASECAKRNVKIIGINYGHLGFLAEFEPERLDFAVDLVCSGNYKTIERSMLKITVGKNVYFALNDLVIQRNTSGSKFSNTIALRCEIDGSTVDNLSSDGIIISTPTGSTAYSLSAGGSILAPGINAFIMTPICAHSLHSRPIVFSDKSTVKIISMRENSSINLIIDGKIVKTVGINQTVTVKKAKQTVKFITLDDGDFYNKLLIKLNIWSK